MNAFYVSGQAGATVDYIARGVRDFPAVFREDTLPVLCHEIIKGALLSFGDLGLPKNFNPDGIVDAFSKNVTKVTESDWMGGIPLFRDSGGYQIRQGGHPRAP
jgi:hypothetical protein